MSMDSSPTLEEKFHAAVKAIQRLPADGAFQPSNEMKLTFYGLYKQATVGPNQQPRPSLFNYGNRMKWDAWEKYRTMSKEAAMSAYIDEIRKILETMPQTNEVLELTQLIGPFYEFVDDYTDHTRTVTTLKKKSSHHHPIEPMTNGIADDGHLHNHTNGPTHTVVSAGNGPGPSSSPSSSSTSTISSSDVEEFYEDPSDRLPINNDEVTSDRDTTRIQPGHVYGGQNGNNVPVHRSQHQSNQASSQSSMHYHHQSSNIARYSPSSMISGGGTSTGGNGRHPNNNYNRETQRAILTALTKLQRDVNNILERLNRLETSSQFLQQRETSNPFHASTQSNSLSRWLPLAGLRRRAIAFIVLWPFFVFALVRLFLRARIIIRFRKARH